MGITAALSLFVALLEGSKLWTGGKMIFEVVCSFIVGLVSGLICLSWQQSLCFQAIAVGAVIDILQGFRVVYSIMEVRYFFEIDSAMKLFSLTFHNYRLCPNILFPEERTSWKRFCSQD